MDPETEHVLLLARPGDIERKVRHAIDALADMHPRLVLVLILILVRSGRGGRQDAEENDGGGWCYARGRHLCKLGAMPAPPLVGARTPARTACARPRHPPSLRLRRRPRHTQKARRTDADSSASWPVRVRTSGSPALKRSQRVCGECAVLLRTVGEGRSQEARFRGFPERKFMLLWIGMGRVSTLIGMSGVGFELWLGEGDGRSRCCTSSQISKQPNKQAGIHLFAIQYVALLNSAAREMGTNGRKGSLTKPICHGFGLTGTSGHVLGESQGRASVRAGGPTGTKTGSAFWPETMRCAAGPILLPARQSARSSTPPTFASSGRMYLRLHWPLARS
jgi:hypothetical protein